MWLSIAGLIFVVILSLKLVTLADICFLNYVNLVSYRGYIYFTRSNTYTPPHDQLNSTDKEVGWIRWDEICTIVLGATCQQGFSGVPFSLASCIVVMVTFFSLYSLFIR